MPRSVDILRTVLLGVAKRGPDTEVDVLVVRCFGDLGRHLHVYCLSCGAFAIGVDVLNLDVNVGSRIGGRW